MHLLFNARFIFSPHFLRVVERHFFPSEMLKGSLVCVLCDSNSFHSFVFKLCIMIIHILKICTSQFVHVSYFSFLTGVLLCKKKSTFNFKDRYVLVFVKISYYHKNMSQEDVAFKSAYTFLKEKHV